MEPRGIELINRYKRNYGIPAQAEITEEMILAHWKLEKKLTKELLESQSENRWEVFEKAYTTLYTKLQWLNLLSEETTPPEKKYANWLEAIGSPPQKIYEVGSGQGKMIAYLAKCGFECKATEITKERGQKHIIDSPENLSWGNSDGVHLDQFEPNEFYDLVVSNQVIEHLYPDDLIVHFQSAYNILNQKGRYIFTTPHSYTGPHDISLVFKSDYPQGMHLKEYTCKELYDALKIAGYKDIYFIVPASVKKLLSNLGIKKEGQLKQLGIFYLNMMFIVEKFLSLIPSQKIRRVFGKSLKKLYLFADNIFLIAQK